MFPLPAGPWPATADELRRQVLEGVRTFTRAAPRLTMAGDWPVLSELLLDFSGVRIDPTQDWPAPRAAVESCIGPECRQLRVLADPLRVGDLAQLRFELQAANVEFEFIRDEADRRWLKPARVGGGSFHAAVTERELNHLFLETARTLTQAHGLAVDDARLQLEPAGPNTIRLEAEIGARKLFLKGRLRFTGAAEFGAALEVQLRGLKCEGVGALAALAARAVQPQLDRLGRQPLRPFGALTAGLTLEHFELKPDGTGTLLFEARIAAAV
jgi:hypothetical protein